MESSVLRIVLFIVLFLILTADYSALMLKVFHMLGVAEHRSQVTPNVVKTAQDDVDKEKDGDKTRMLNEAMEMFASSSKNKLMSTIKNACLPKLICELNASHKEKLTESEKSLLALIRDTSISVTAEVTSRYHFAAHMGQLIAGVDGAGCHNFYPTCPFPGMQVLQMLNKVSRVAR